MIRSLRRRFIAIAMASLIGTMAVVFAAVGVGNYWLTAKRMDNAISILYQSGGSFQPPPARLGPPFDPARPDFQVTPETPFETRYFIVKLTESGEIRSVELDHIAAMDRMTVAKTVGRIMEKGSRQGYLEHYRFGVFPDKDGGSTVVVLDCFLQLQSSINTLRVTGAVFIVCSLMVFLLILFFSKRAIRPFAENLERQRQFITDASHELKTPLAIITADLGLLEYTCGGDKWLKSAKAQAARLDKLIKDLVELSRTEEAVETGAMEYFSLSETAYAGVEAFQPLAEAAGKSLDANIAEDISIKGVQENFLRLFSILLDNAVKYCDPEGKIILTLELRGKNVCISVSNPCAGLDASQLPRYFDRFYRADSSRARSTGGYGIGLSTAKAVVVRHGGRISCGYEKGVVTFKALVPGGRYGR